MNEIDTENNNRKILLAEMIRKLRQELVLARAQSKDEGIQFELEKVEMELKVVVSSTGKGHAGVEFWVVSTGGDYEKKDETSHTIKLTLNVRDRKSGNKVSVSDVTTSKVSES